MVPWPRVVIISPWEVLARRLVSPVPWDSHTTCQSSALHCEPNAVDMSSSIFFDGELYQPQYWGTNSTKCLWFLYTVLHSSSLHIFLENTHAHTFHHYFTLEFDSPTKNNNGFLVSVQTAQSYDLSEVLRCFFCLKTNCRWLRWARVKMQARKNRGLCGWLQIT